MSISRRSSITFVPSRSNLRLGDSQAALGSPVYEEAERSEIDIEQYGDEPQDPAPKSPKFLSKPSPILKPPAKEQDPNLVTWDGPDDPENPQNWSNGYKWMITVITIIMSVNVTYASSAPTPASEALVKQFGINLEVSYIVTTCFLLGYTFGPLFWGPGSELLGRRPIFIVTMTIYTLFHLGQALAPNIQTLLITRFLGGFFAVAPLTNAGGVIADMFSAENRGIATSMFTLGVFIGPVSGPVVSGFIIGAGVSWRWVFWVMMIFAGVCTLIMIPLLPETYAPVILYRKTKRLRKADPVGNANLYAEYERQDWSFNGVFQRTLLRPFQMLALEPILALITLYISIVYSLLYLSFEALPIVFSDRRGFSISQTGLIFIGIGIGTTLGSLTNAFLSRDYKMLIRKWKGFPPPERRLRGAMVGAPTLVIAIFWLGWTGEYKAVPWYVPALSTVLLGFSINLIFVSFLSYMVDTYLMFSASAFAANTFARSAAAAAFPLFTVQMFTRLRINWACTLIGFIAILFLPSPYLFYKFGSRIREKSRFAPCIDLKIAKELEAEELSRKEKELRSVETLAPQTV